MSALALLTSATRPKRGKVYKKKKSQFKGSKERLRQKCKDLKLTHNEALGHEKELKEENLRLRR